MEPPTVTTLANDPNIAVALAASQYLTCDPFDACRFSETPTQGYTILSTRLTGLGTSPLMLRRLLYALAAISATTAPTGNEAIACTLRRDSDHPTRPTVELILSSHEPVRRKTVRFLRKIWTQMLAISAIPDRRQEARSSYLHLLRTFGYMVYTHTLPKLRADFTMHMQVIDHWKAQITAENGELSVNGCGDDARVRELLVETLLYLERCRSAFAQVTVREDDQVPNRLILTSDDVVAVVTAMEPGGKVAGKLLLLDIPLQVLSTRCFGSKNKNVLRNAFESITELPRHITELLHFAMHHMESLQTHNLLLTIVSPVAATPHIPWPQTKQTWERIREHILKDKDYTASARVRPDQEDFLPAPDSLVVYPELTLATYLHALHFHPMHARPSASSIPPGALHPLHPEPFNYIAVSSPPCAPSALWINAYNTRHAYRGDSLRVAIRLAPYAHWNTAGAGRYGWRWVPLPAVPGDDVDEGAASDTGTRTASVAGPGMRTFRREPCEAEERIVAAAWDAYLIMAKATEIDIAESLDWGRKSIAKSMAAAAANGFKS